MKKVRGSWRLPREHPERILEQLREAGMFVKHPERELHRLIVLPVAPWFLARSIRRLTREKARLTKGNSKLRKQLAKVVQVLDEED